mmetsp:Transcript_120824/g.385777  ORF Transcript_120824/g.385777 Transcript_120824/m.385777 type:complete len:218 (+) Transcript_120824:539-1192(+)
MLSDTSSKTTSLEAFNLVVLEGALEVKSWRQRGPHDMTIHNGSLETTVHLSLISNDAAEIFPHDIRQSVMPRCPRSKAELVILCPGSYSSLFVRMLHNCHSTELNPRRRSPPSRMCPPDRSAPFNKAVQLYSGPSTWWAETLLANVPKTSVSTCGPSSRNISPTTSTSELDGMSHSSDSLCGMLGSIWIPSSQCLLELSEDRCTLYEFGRTRTLKAN